MRRKHFAGNPVFLIAVFVLSLANPTGASEPGAAISFSRDVRPILNQHCIACHGGVKKEGGISFIYRREALGDGESGERTILPGQPEASELIRRVMSTDDNERMPPADHGPRLSDKEINTLEQWIREEAAWGQHWSFELPTRHSTPTVQNSTWPKNAIDHFILSKLEEKSLQPSPPAEPAVLLRRLSFDLTGLPPTTEDLDRFEAAAASNPEAAYVAEVDRLLASKHFGERWASNWLDLARYADSEGLGEDTNRPMHAYRDWVIRAHNEDMPYDQFTIKQIAGDLVADNTLDDRIATAFLRLTQSNSENGTDDEEFRMLATLDRVSTTWETWQGITFRCAQCHSHPYEPIEHKEYYQFLAFFDNGYDQDLSFHHPVMTIPNQLADAAKVHEMQTRVAAIREARVNETIQLNKQLPWMPVAHLGATGKPTKLTTKQRDGYTEFLVDGEPLVRSVYTLKIPVPENFDQLTALRLDHLPVSPEKAIHSGEWGAMLSQIQVFYQADDGGEVPVKLVAVLGDDPASHILPGHSIVADGFGWGPYTKIYRPRSAVIVLDQPLELNQGGALRVELSYLYTPLGNFPAVAQRGRVALSASPEWIEHIKASKYVARQVEFNQLKAHIGALASTTLPIIKELPPHMARETRVFKRGNWLDKGDEKLRPGVPAALPPMKTANPNRATRLDMARWLASKENPLTARVAVNRCWEQLFGRGLVETLEDLGSSGFLPTHPELLDDLAVRFQTEMKWSTKTLLREIILSSTYRQSPNVKQDVLAIDPGNRYLARGPRSRLSAEMVRDHLLRSSGLLNSAMYGPGTYPPIPAGGWTPAQGGAAWTTPDPGTPDRYRRAIYTYIKRSSPYPDFANFDAPSRDVCTQRRIMSNTPLAALSTLNSPAYVEAAQALAVQLDQITDATPDEKIGRGYRLATSRKIKAEQTVAIVNLYRAIAEKDGPEVAMFSVASLLLNLDDSLNK